MAPNTLPGTYTMDGCPLRRGSINESLPSQGTSADDTGLFRMSDV